MGGIQDGSQDGIERKERNQSEWDVLEFNGHHNVQTIVLHNTVVSN